MDMQSTEKQLVLACLKLMLHQPNEHMKMLIEEVIGCYDPAEVAFLSVVSCA